MSVSTLPARVTAAPCGSLDPVAPLSAEAQDAQSPVTLTFDQTVPRSFVHRAGVGEVFLTDGARLDEQRVRIAAQWPRSHALYHPDAAGGTDPMLLIETVRQASIYTAHRFQGVPLTQRFIFRALDVQIDDPAALQTGSAPLSVLLDGRFEYEGSRSAKRTGACFSVTVEVNGRQCARASARFLAVDERLYSVLRHRGTGAVLPQQGIPVGLPVLLSADQVGQLRPENVLLSLEPGTASGEYGMHLDIGHPNFFEHSSDHVPGMALLEAFRQAGHHLVHAGPPEPGHEGVATQRLAASAASFDSFGELSEGVRITAREADGIRGAGRLVQLQAVQGERTLARASAVYRPALAY